jgi:hypothetical protein
VQIQVKKLLSALGTATPAPKPSVKPGASTAH